MKNPASIKLIPKKYHYSQKGDLRNAAEFNLAQDNVICSNTYM